MLEATSEKNGRVVDVSKILKEDDEKELEDGLITSVFGVSTYYNALTAHDDGIVNGLESFEFVEDTKRETDEQLEAQWHKQCRKVYHKRTGRMSCKDTESHRARYSKCASYLERSI